MIKILHITPHTGGGVGNVIARLSTASDNRMQHKIILLEKPIKEYFIDKSKEAGVEVLICPSQADISKCIEACDVVVVHWWHHPKTSKFLYGFPQIPSRMIFWSHISNLTVPAINPDFLFKASKVLFTTEASYEAEVFADIPIEILNDKTGIVYGCGGFDDFPKVVHTEHKEFNIGYLGLIDFSKLHPDFVEFCNAINIAEARFIMVGDAPAKDMIKKQVHEKGIENEFIFNGYTDDIISTLCDFDVFGYPLMPYHTCTTENAILEAMAAEVPPILLNQLTEKYIVQNGETGILVSSKEEYGNAVRYLYTNPDVRRAMGKAAREFVLQKYTLRKFLDSFYENCEITMNQPKQIIDFSKTLGETPAEWFISCLGKDAAAFRQSNEQGASHQSSEVKKMILSSSPLLRKENKSSVLQYQREYPKDPMLNEWKNILREEEQHGY